MFTHCESSAYISIKDIKVNKNIELTLPLVHLPNHVGCSFATSYPGSFFGKDPGSGWSCAALSKI
jgi:hypothetical protein